MRHAPATSVQIDHHDHHRTPSIAPTGILAVRQKSLSSSLSTTALRLPPIGVSALLSSGSPRPTCHNPSRLLDLHPSPTSLRVASLTSSRRRFRPGLRRRRRRRRFILLPISRRFTLLPLPPVFGGTSTLTLGSRSPRRALLRGFGLPRDVRFESLLFETLGLVLCEDLTWVSTSCASTQ